MDDLGLDRALELLEFWQRELDEQDEEPSKVGRPKKSHGRPAVSEEETEVAFAGIRKEQSKMFGGQNRMSPGKRRDVQWAEQEAEKIREAIKKNRGRR